MFQAKLASSWKAQALFKKFDARANHKVYGKGRISASGKVLIIGAGPCGMRAAIECQLLGAKVVSTSSISGKRKDSQVLWYIELCKYIREIN